jgi:hypothetical protein
MGPADTGREPPMADPAEGSDEPDAEARQTAAAASKRSVPRAGKALVLVVLLLAIAGAAGWRLYGDRLAMDEAAEIPLIRAERGPAKVRPEKPGGMEIPDRDKLVYDRIGDAERPAVEHLLPAPEAPLAPPAPEKPPAEPAEARAPAASAAPEEAPPPPAPEIEAAPEAAPPAETAAVPGAGYRVQLAAARSRELAEGEWTRLKGRHEDLLGALGPTIRRIDLGAGKGVFYRLRAGPLDGEAAASYLCTLLTQRGVGCLVVRPGG